MMVVLKIVSATPGYDVQIVVTAGPNLTRLDECTIERIVGIVHLIHAEYSLEASLIKGFVVSHKRQSFYLGLYLLPHIGEDGRFLSVLTAEPIDAGTNVIIIVGLGMDKRVELVYFLAITDYDDADRAYTGPLEVGCLEVYRCEIFHCLSFCGQNGVSLERDQRGSSYASPYDTSIATKLIKKLRTLLSGPKLFQCYRR